MRPRRRRRLDAALIVAGGLGVGVASLAGALAGDNERITNMWVMAEMASDGSARVTEVIDYDFGALPRDKHGITRTVPGLEPNAEAITVQSDSAPDDVDVSTSAEGTRLRIGSPSQTVSGEHRYRIEFPLNGVARETTIDWEALGTLTKVDIEHAEVHLVAPYELVDMRCFKGSASGSPDSCDVRQVAPGHVAVDVDGLSGGEGVSLEGRTGSDVAAPPAVPEPPSHPGDDEPSPLEPAGAAAAGALLAGLPTARLVRRAGRERVGAGGAADAAWSGAEPVIEVRLDHAELEAMATTEFAPPDNLTPPRGGIVLAEQLNPEHKVAWLIDAAIEGSIDLVEDGNRVVGLTRTAPGSSETSMVLDTAFAGRTEIDLQQYDSAFANAWSAIGVQLEYWHANSGLWDDNADRRRVTVRALGLLGAVVGVAGAALGGLAVSRWGSSPWLALAVVGGLVAGAGVAAAVRGWELRVRTPAGSAAWLRVESFRRFLAESEAFHAEEAAKRGVLREYTAWAVALGEIDRWSRAVQAASTVIPADAGLAYAYLAPSLMLSAASASTEPSSSGGGGSSFGGGGVGGGAGGGGVDSW